MRVVIFWNSKTAKLLWKLIEFFAEVCRNVGSAIVKLGLHDKLLSVSRWSDVSSWTSAHHAVRHASVKHLVFFFWNPAVHVELWQFTLALYSSSCAILQYWPSMASQMFILASCYCLMIFVIDTRHLLAKDRIVFYLSNASCHSTLFWH